MNPHYEKVAEIIEKFIPVNEANNTLFVNELADLYEEEDYITIDICKCGCEEKVMEGMPISGTYFVCKKCGYNCDHWKKTRKERFGAFIRTQFLKKTGVKQ